MGDDRRNLCLIRLWKVVQWCCDSSPSVMGRVLGVSTSTPRPVQPGVVQGCRRCPGCVQRCSGRTIVHRFGCSSDEAANLTNAKYVEESVHVLAPRKQHSTSAPVPLACTPRRAQLTICVSCSILVEMEPEPAALYSALCK